jgi:CheY-like chemotaxis protein
MFGRKKVAGKRTVLFVDDDTVILLSIVRDLQDQPYNILSASGSTEALEILQQKDVHVIVTDMCMPEMNGLELLRTVRKEYPDIIGLVLTGYLQDIELLTAVEDGEVFKLIPKPWKSGGNFEKLIRRAIEHYNLITILRFLVNFLLHIRLLRYILFVATVPNALSHEGRFSGVLPVCETPTGTECRNSHTEVVSANTRVIIMATATNIKETLRRFIHSPFSLYRARDLLEP